MTFLLQVLRISGPYGLAALAGTVSRVSAAWSTSPWKDASWERSSDARRLLDGFAVAGVLCGILAGMLLSCLHAWASLRHRVDQIVSGLACNFLAALALRAEAGLPLDFQFGAHRGHLELGAL